MKFKYMSIWIIIFFLLSLTNGFGEVKDYLDELYCFFPSAEEMEGGANRWLITDINKQIFNDYVLLERNYNSFNKNPEKIWDIQREKSFKVNVKLYFCRNFSVSENLFKKLSARRVPFKRKVNFGDKGIMLIEPIKSKFMKADYELIFINKTFILSLKSKDGFALMDFADYFESKIASFILKNFDKFFIKKLNLEVSADGYRSVKKPLTFVTNDIKNIIISGKIVDSLSNPISNVKVILKDFKQETTTDETGKYKLSVKLNGQNELVFEKNFILEPVSTSSQKESDVSIYSVKMKYKMNLDKRDDFYLKMIKTDNGYIGRSFKNKKQDGLKIIKMNNNSIKFIKDCSNSFSAFRCRQIFTGSYDENKMVGTWKGTGGGGSWNASILKPSYDKISLNKAGCSLKTVILDLNGKLKSVSDGVFIFKNDEEQGYIKLECNNNNNNFFLNRVYLNLTNIESNKRKIPLMVYNVRKISDIYEFINGKKAVDIVYSEEPYPIKIDVTELFKENIDYVLIGYPVDLNITTLNKFGNMYDFNEIQPYLLFEKFVESENKNTKNLFEFIKNNKYDLASNSSKPKPDGKKDLHLRLRNLGFSGDLTYVEVSFSGNGSYIWNTNIFDIYPGIIISLKNKYYKNETGSLRLSLKNGDTLDFFMYKPDKLSIKGGNFFIKLIVNNRQYNFKLNLE